MKARLTLLIIFLTLPASFLFYTYSPAKNESSCVTCHTDEAMLKKTCKPFVMPEGEGEG
jgi:hypothetical protein